MQKRIITLVVAGIAMVLASIWAISSGTVRAMVAQTLENRLAVSKVIGRSVDNLLHENLIKLSDMAVLLGRLPEKEILKSAHERSIFSGNLYLLKEDGEIATSYPGVEPEPLSSPNKAEVLAAMKKGKPHISNLKSLPDGKRRVIQVIVPLKGRRGENLGAVFAAIIQPNYKFKELLKSFPADEKSAVYLVDGNGEVIASNISNKTTTFKDHDRFIANLISYKKSGAGKCHGCHAEGGSDIRDRRDIIAVSPISITTWGVVVIDPGEIVFGWSQKIQSIFLVTGATYIFFALLLAIGLSKSIVLPVRKLIGSAKEIADGNLARPIIISRGHEIGALAESLEAMRKKLQISLQSVREYSEDLEELVYKRTQKLKEQSEQRAILLKQLLRTQEDERKRVARELHDETSQAIIALGMALEVSSNRLEEKKLTPQDILDLKKRTDELLEGVNRLINDMRPPALDDLDFKSAIRWLLEKKLGSIGINYAFKASPEFSEKRSGIITEYTELRLFRIVQEAVTNIARHAKAKNVKVSFLFNKSLIQAKIKDDGVGFNPALVFKKIDGEESVGYGLLGIRERAEHLGGNISIHSKPDKGTELIVNIPLSDKDTRDENR